MRYSGRDIALIASLSVVSGVVFTVTSHVLASPAYAIGGHYGVAVIYGLWFVGGTLTGYVVRKPWSAFLGETIGAIIELLALSPYSVLLYYYGPAQGFMSEIAFRVFRYERLGYKAMVLAGALPALAAYPFDATVSPFYPEAVNYTLQTHVSLLALYIISGALISGVLVKIVVDAVRRP